MSKKNLNLENSLDAFKFPQTLANLLENTKLSDSKTIASSETVSRQTDSEMIAGSVSADSDSIAGSVSADTETVVSSVSLDSDTLPSSEMIADSKTVLDSETVAAKTVVSSETIASKTVVGSETVVIGSELSLEQVEKIIFKILPVKEITYTCKTMLCYLLLKEKKDVIQINYRRVLDELNIYPSGVSRGLLTLNTVADIEQFKIKQELFVSFKKMTDSETVACSSSSYLNNNTTTRQNFFSNEKFSFGLAASLLLHNFDNDYINKKIIDALRELENIDVMKVFFYVKAKKPTSKIPFTFKCITDKWYEAISDKQVKELEEQLEIVRNVERENLADLGKKEIIEYLKALKVSNFSNTDDVEHLRVTLELFKKQLRTLITEIKKTS